MTGSNRHQPGQTPGDASSRPHVAVVATLRAASGATIAVPVRVTNRASAERAIVVTAVGIDPGWLGVPARTAPLAPGASEVVTLELTPSQGTLPASYPLVVTALAVDPVSGRAESGTRPGQAETTLVVSPRSRLTVELQPAELRAISSRKLTVVLRNTGGADAQVTLRADHPRHGRIGLRKHTVVVPPDGEVRVKARARLNRPRFLGYGSRHAFKITASTPESVRFGQGTLEQRAVIGPWGLKAVAIIAIVAVWLGGAGFLIAKISQSQREKSQEDAAALADAAGGDEAADEAGDDGGSDDGGEEGEDAAGSEDDAAGEKAPPLQLAGTVADQPGVTVRLQATSLVDEEAQGAHGVGVDDDDLDGDGKRPAAAFVSSAPEDAPPTRTITTDDQGAWALSKVKAPGYYLLTFSKPGYQTERYVVDSSSEAAKEPLEIEMTSGTGSLSGRITGPDGAVGGAQVTISDGINTLTTSSNSDGANAGRWSIEGLSAPGTYVVSATRRDMSSEARVVEVQPYKSSTADLKLTSGVALVEGSVSATGLDGDDFDLGGATVTVTDGDELTRTATTLTVEPRGRFYLPSLPVPGDYTVTVSAEGYQTQSTHFELPRRTSRLLLDPTELDSVNGRLLGTVAGEPSVGATLRHVAGTKARAKDAGMEPLPGVGLTLVNNEHAYKATSASPVDGTSGFAFDYVVPGVYTLTASFFNRVTVTRTVKVEPGPPAEGSTLHLILDQLPDGALPSTSRVTGEVVDVANGREIPTCTDGRLPTKPLQDGCITATLDVPDDKFPAFTDTFPYNGGYELPSDEQCAALKMAQCGLKPGLYTVQVSAPGYLPSSVEVEVGQGRTIAAPLVELTAVPSVSGSVTLANPASASRVFDPDTGELVTNPALACVWLVTAGTSTTVPGCKDAIDAGKLTGAEKNANACLADRSVDRGQSGRSRWCAATGIDGKYLIEAPRRGPYVVVVVPRYPHEFVADTQAQLFLDSGPEQFDAQLKRLGRVVLTVRQPPGETQPAESYGRLVEASNAVITLIGSGDAAGVSRDVVLDSLVAGSQTVTGLRPGTYAITGTSAGGAHNGRLATDLTVEYDASPPAKFDLTDPVSDFLVQVVGFDRAIGSALPTGPAVVPDATVEVTGGTAWNSDGTLADDTAHNKLVSAVSNAQGCLAIVRDAATSPSDSTACTTPVGGTARAVMPSPSFVTTRMPNVKVAASTSSANPNARGWQPLDRTGYYLQSQSIRTPIVLLPAPVSLDPATSPGALITLKGSSGNLASSIGVTVDSGGRSIAASLVFVSADTAANESTYKLSWVDSSKLGMGLSSTSYPQANDDVTPGTAVPGKYTVHFANSELVPTPGKTTHDATLTCTRTAGSCTLANRTLTRQGSLDVIVKGPGGELVNQAKVKLSSVTSPETSGTTGSVSFPGLEPFSNTGTIEVKAKGYAYTTVSSGNDALACTLEGAGASSTILSVLAGKKTTCVVTLAKLGTIEGQLRAVRTYDLEGTADGSSYTVVETPQNVPVTAECISGSCTGQTFAATTRADGFFTIDAPVDGSVEGPRAGTYRLSATYAGFTYTGNAADREVAVVNGSASTKTFTMRANRNALTVTVKDQFLDPVAGAGVTLSRSQTTALGSDITAVAGPTAGTYRFSAVYPGTWYVKVTGTGLPALSTSGITLADKANESSPYAETVGVDRNLAQISGTATEAGVTPVRAVAGATATLYCSATDDRGDVYCPDGQPAQHYDGPTLKPLRATADTAGLYTLSGIPVGVYDLVVTAPGYADAPTPGISVSYGQVLTDKDAQLTAVEQTVEVTVMAGANEPLAGSSVVLTPVGGTPGTAVPLTLSSTTGTQVVKLDAATGNGLRFGCYSAVLTMADGHFGHIAGPTTNTVDADSGCSAGNVRVPIAAPPGGKVTVDFTVTSQRFAWTYTATSQSNHPVPDPTASTLRITGPSGFAKTLPLAASGTVWLPGGTGYQYRPQLAFAPGGSYAGYRAAWWPTPTMPITFGGSTPTPINLVESQVTLTVSVQGLVGDATIEVSPVDPSFTAPTEAIKTIENGGTTTFQLPYGEWLVEGDWDDGPGSTVVTLDDPSHGYPVQLVPIPADPPADDDTGDTGDAGDAGDTGDTGDTGDDAGDTGDDAGDTP